ncbi:MAG: hypothetical protein ACD_81C00109G0001 [uncultured bacterium]|uniref:Uncharacterized protein n=2 Tax=Candidatus Wolfeibacteriota TaxID=1752735 RepID=A0A0G1H8V5_9BACT|nr:MAG: hypothetical protein ACD_81C00109G0001 [uncultured bacterium]KKR12869.1 MAG: hypothetical protein UT41_C0001G0413 [Candidatus Wolfebacteria bacterium GW2011_GWC2_39_22]KKT43801.1 MAG: hypothetical protein UW32_C0001G0393 [Candidatus Wolfebacteria bacterium GW2011_GWE2_44_13]HBI25470.1 hypothetical protein [Candidatus Wolfebacteria bacterium]
MNLLNKPANAYTIGISGSIKIGILAFVGIVFALGFSWFFREFLLTGEWTKMLWSGLSSIGFLVVFTLQTFFMRSNTHFAVAFFLQSLALISFFFALSVPIMTLFVVVYGGLLSASYSGRKMLDNMLTIDFWSISKLVVPKGIIAITLLASVFIPLHLQAHRDSIPVSSATFDKVLASSSSFIKYFYKDFDTSKTVDELARTATEQQLSEKFPQVNALKPREKTLLINEAMKGLYEQLFNYTGVQINPKDPVAVAAYGVLQEKYFALRDEVKLWIFIIFGAVIFISIASIMMPLRILVALIAFFVYEVMIALGFARVVIESRSKETFVL